MPITLKIDNKIRKTLRGDPHRLSQIFYNLIGNSIKFTEEGDITISAKLLKQDVDTSKILFKVKDTGKGIAKYQLQNIFETFNQASLETSAQFGGTGLGLSICKDLVEMQGGEIGAKSKINEGSTFHFTLSLLNTQGFENEDVYDDGEMMSFENGKVLAAEDNPLNKMVIQKILNKWNANTTQVCNGKEAVEILVEEGEMFDVILMDIRMPVMNGYDAAALITNNKNESINSIPILAVTASMLDFNDDQTKNSDMVDFVLKSFNPNELYAKITKHIEQNQKALV
ncbi:MAG: CheY-like chemotaxis protein [Sphingobacteriales bacterium]